MHAKKKLVGNHRPLKPNFTPLSTAALEGGGVSAADLVGRKFNTLPFTGKWLRIIGRPTPPFKIMFYGLPGSGKSSLSLQFANYLATSLHQRVLYVASEEGLNYTMQEKLQRFKVTSPNIMIVDKLPANLSFYDVVFIDSVNHSGLDAVQLRALDQTKSYVYVFQSTKDGKFRGSNDYLHDVDVCIKVHEMMAQPEKNRFGATGKARVID